MRRAYSYVRFSSAEQGKGDSLRRQLKATEDLVQKHGWVLDQSLTMQDLGVSAFRGSNVEDGAFGLFLEAIRTGRVPPKSILVVESLDRVSRAEPFDSQHLVLGILKQGVAIATIQPERVYEPGGSDQVLKALEILLILSRAHEESVTKSTRVKAAWMEKRKHAATTPMTAKCPAWLELTEKGFVEVKAAADAVRLIYKLCREGLGVRRITKTLIDWGVEPFGGKSDKWAMTYVHKILTWPAVYGEHQLHVTENKKQVKVGDPISGYYPAVVSEHDFYSAQAILGQRKKRSGRASNGDQNLFTGMVYHAIDKVTMVLKRPTGGEQKYLYLVSGAYLHGKKSGGTTSFPYHPFERAVLETVCELRASDVTDRERGAGKSAEDEMQRLSGEVEAIDLKLARTNQRAQTANDIEPFLDLIEQLNKQKKGLLAELEALKTKAAVSQAKTLVETKSMIVLLASAKGEEAKRLRRRVKTQLHAIIEKVWVLIEQRGVRRAAQGQIVLKSGHVRPFVAYNRPVRTTDEHFPLTDLTGIDLRDYAPVASSA
jgi:DNA invertase Pin-like site-specific DNA recombinase